MRIPIGPLLNFEDGLNPRTGSAFSARLSSTSPKDFMFRCQLFDYFNESGEIMCTQRFACTHGVPMYTPVNTTVPFILGGMNTHCTPSQCPGICKNPHDFVEMICQLSVSAHKRRCEFFLNIRGISVNIPCCLPF